MESWQDKGKRKGQFVNSPRRRKYSFTGSRTPEVFRIFPLYKEYRKNREKPNKKSGHPKPASRGNRRHTPNTGAAFRRVWLSYHQPEAVAITKRKETRP